MWDVVLEHWGLCTSLEEDEVDKLDSVNRPVNVG